MRRRFVTIFPTLVLALASTTSPALAQNCETLIDNLVTSATVMAESNQRIGELTEKIENPGDGENIQNLKTERNAWRDELSRATSDVIVAADEFRSKLCQSGGN